MLALLDESLPPTVHLQTPDPEFGLDFIQGAARAARVLQFIGRFAMVDIFAISIIVSVMAAGTIGQGDNPGPAAVETVTTLQSGFYLFIAYVLVSFAIDVLLAIRHRVTGA